MEIVGVIIAIVVIVAIYWFVIRKPGSVEQLPEPQEPKRIAAPPDRPKAGKQTGQEPAKAKAQTASKKAESESSPSVPKKTESKAPEAKKPETQPTDSSVRSSPQTAQAAQESPAAETEPAEPKTTGTESSEDAEPVQQPPSAKEPAEDSPAPLVAQAVDVQVTTRARDVQGLRKGLGKSRTSDGFFGRLAKLITGRKEIDPSIVDEIEEVLITSDVGVKTTEAILERLREGLRSKEFNDSDKVWDALRREAVRILSLGAGGLTLRSKPTVVLMVGVNGSGKTTTIGKLATQLKADGSKVLLAAGDTFRAAAVQQLQVWGDRVGVDVVKGKDGADAGAVIFDAIRRGHEQQVDVVLADTAGRLHTKTNLMEELKKVVRTMGKALEGAPHEILLVLDATNGQNAVAQSRQFAEALPLSGIILTKLDGTAKGGVILGICDELKVPVRYVGLGEKADDLRPFDAEEFVEALLGGAESEDNEAA